jgi:hypothetical protein
MTKRKKKSKSPSDPEKNPDNYWKRILTTTGKLKKILKKRAKNSLNRGFMKTGAKPALSA